MKSQNYLLTTMLAAVLLPSINANAQWTRNAVPTPAHTYLTNTTDNVGIGTTTPAFKLDIQGTGITTMSFKSTTDNASILLDRGASNKTSSLTYRTAGANNWQTGCVSNNNYTIRNNNLGSVAMFFDYTNNNVGIGTTSPASKLDVAGNGRITTAPLGTTYSSLLLNSTTNAINYSLYEPLQLSNGGYFGGAVTGIGFYNSGTTFPTGKIISTLNSGGSGARMDFYVMDNGNASQNRVSIDNNGNVGIGTATPADKLDVAGKIRISNGGYGLHHTSGTTAIGTWVDGVSGQIGTFTNHPLWFFTQDSPNPGMVLTVAGNLGVGTTAPVNRFEVGDYGNNNDTYIAIKTAGGNVHKAGIKLRHYNDDYGFDIISDETLNGFGGFLINHHLASGPGNNVFCIDAAENVGIGTTTPSAGYKLTVTGKILCTELRVQAMPFPDYVFDKNYKLNTLTEVEEHINTYKRLPGMPSGCEVEDTGMAVGEMQTKLVEKIEELTLYIIQQQKQSDEQQKQIDELKKLVNASKK